MLNLNLLYSFFICAEHLNISKAAGVLGMSQPSLSMQIKNLEEQVGSPLFLRNGKSISLTSKGRELLDLSPLFYDLREEVQKKLETKAAPEEKSSLRIHVTHEVERPFVAEVVSKLAKRGSRKMAILTSTTEEALNKTENDETDILLSHEKVESTWNHVKVDFPVFFATSEKAPSSPVINDASNIQKILDFFGQDLIVPTKDTKLGEEFQTFRRKHGFKKNIVLESNIVSCLVRFVASGSGCAFLPLPYVKSSLYQDRIHLLGPREGFWKHSIYIYANIPKKDLEVHPLVKHIRNYGST
ncbi:MAG: LysR family transcriptional regulator [Bacteriovoracaceae bacterium]